MNLILMQNVLIVYLKRLIFSTDKAVQEEFAKAVTEAGLL